MLFQYIGDPENDFDGPRETSHLGFHFVKGGQTVDVSVREGMSPEKVKVVENAIRFFRNSNHFRLMTPEKLRAEARAKAAEARAMAESAEEEARRAGEEAAAELERLSGRADGAVAEDGDDDDDDEAAVADEVAPTSGGPRRKRRSDLG